MDVRKLYLNPPTPSAEPKDSCAANIDPCACDGVPSDDPVLERTSFPVWLSDGCAQILSYGARASLHTPRPVMALFILEAMLKGAQGTIVASATIANGTSTNTIEGVSGSTRFVPGVYVSVAFGQDTAPAPVTVSIAATLDDGTTYASGSCVINIVRGRSMGVYHFFWKADASGSDLATPAFARLRHDALIKTVAANYWASGAPASETTFNYTDETIVVTATGPNGAVVTAQSLSAGAGVFARLYKALKG